jgi:putative flavoprotein involved in K+ transport
LGFTDVTVDQLPSPKAKFAASAHGTGKDGGHTINLHQFARDGVVLLGRIQGVQDGRITLAPDLGENLARADKFEADFVKQVNEYIKRSGLDAPTESLPELRDGYEAEVILELDPKSVGINSVVWATGYRFDFSLVKLPVFDKDGYPVQKRGVTDYPGLYFVDCLSCTPSNPDFWLVSATTPPTWRPRSRQAGKHADP